MAKTIIIVIGCALAITLVLLLCQSNKILKAGANMNNSNELKTSPCSHELTGKDASTALAVNSSRQQLLLLHRQKRYLLFPEGSSFQLVFDLIIPIVDYTNFAILGITCAVAWELPSKPPSELLDNLRTRLNDGTLGTVRRNDSVLGTVTTGNGNDIRTAVNWQAMHAQPTSTSASASASGSASNVDSYSYYTNVQNVAGASVYANSPNGEQHARRPANWHTRQSIPKWRQWANSPPNVQTANQIRGNADHWSDNWWQRNKERVEQNWRKNQQQWSSYEQPTSRYSYQQRPRQMLRERPKHQIYPVFGKRRRRRDVQPYVEDVVIERLHLDQHLSSRGLLFGKIERLYKSRQLNGTACIQRALCESGQRQAGMRQAAAEPQSFIMELVSAIFQLPSSNEAGEVLKHISPHYLEAHQQQGNCRQIYGDCSHTFWLE
ncbi:uncharacterized protein [Drosophila virilis]|uniref:uncharacterized protein isoform X2 n=1 Tax=Drosophila virilis TaxID=7244 RepID=UPI001396552C|nr:uncharacterized protein LOC6629338 isoform X2 [Drosophila virilis]